VRDGVKLARNGLPAVSLVTEEFWDQGNFVAQSLGMPDVPRVQLPHPIAGTGDMNIGKVAEKVTEEILDSFSA
jgi:hypothetical protein|tara:strand:+ start:590 stop:808 length:219 start_codon:yes stop_codon:yes gene_type:complete